MMAFWSLNEIESLSRKAARGAGYDWGLAEEAGQAVRWLQARKLPGADALLSACRAGSAGAPDTCPVMQGCVLSDSLAGGFDARDVVAPLLLLPFVAWTAEQSKSTMCLRWHGAEFSVTSDSELRYRADAVSPKRAEVSVSHHNLDGLDTVSVEHRAEVNSETFSGLSKLAGRTYAPATEASRESGAGAGLTDND